MGWDISDIGSPAHIEEFQEEILIVWIPVTLTAKSFDFVPESVKFSLKKNHPAENRLDSQ